MMKNPLDPEVNGALGMVLHAHDQLEAAVICYQRAHILQPYDKRWAYYLGSVQMGSRKYAEAASRFREVLKIDPHDLPAQLQLARSLLETGKWSESQRVYDDILQEHPHVAEAHYGEGRVLSALGRQDDAIRHYRAACDLAGTYGAAHYALALAYRDLARSEEADKEFSLYQRDPVSAPEVPDPLLEQIAKLNSGSALDHIKRGVSLEASGNLRQAATEQEHALELDSQLVQAHINLVSLYTKLGQRERAEHHYAEGLKINPDRAELHYNYGLALAAQSRFKEAADAFRQALQINPLFADAHLNLGLALEEQGRSEEAIQHYRLALENNPAYRLAEFRLGRAMLARGDARQAIEFFLASISPEDEQTALYMFGLATAYAESGAHDKAVFFGRKAREKALTFRQVALAASIDHDLGLWESPAGTR
jgi:tetratricopeptide (TPR) repeat protein